MSHSRKERRRKMNSNIVFNTLTRNEVKFRKQPYYTWKISAGVVRLSHYRNSTSSASKTFNWCSQCSKCSKTFWGIGQSASFHDQLHDRSWQTNPVPDPEKPYYTYYINYIRGSTTSRNPWNSTSRKPYYTRGDLPRVVRLIWLNVSYLTVICYVINNRCIIVIKYAVGQLDRPRKILVESAKSAKSAMFLKGLRGLGSSLISHEGETLPYALKHPTDFTDLTDHAVSPRRGTYGNSMVCKPYRPRGNFPRSVRLFRLNNAYSTVACYVLNNTCIGLGVLV